MKLAALKMLARFMQMAMLVMIPGTLALGMAESFMKPPPSCYFSLYLGTAASSPACSELLGAVGAMSGEGAWAVAQGATRVDRGGSRDMLEAAERSEAIVRSLKSAVKEDKRRAGTIQIEGNEVSVREITTTQVHRLSWVVDHAVALLLCTGILALFWLLFSRIPFQGANFILFGVSILVLAGGIAWGILNRSMQPPLHCYIRPDFYQTLEPRPYCGYEDAELDRRLTKLRHNLVIYQKGIAEAEARFEATMMEQTRVLRLRREDATLREPQALTDLRIGYAETYAKRDIVLTEIGMRSIPMDFLVWLGVFWGLVGVIFSVVNHMGGGATGRAKKTKLDGRVKQEKNRKVIPESRYAGMVALAFDTAEDAIAYLREDDLTHCNYCEEPLEIDLLGTVSEVTYVKERPADVIGGEDIILGVKYYPEMVPARTCKKCGHKNLRGNV